MAILVGLAAPRDTRATPDRAGDTGLDRDDLDACVGSLEGRGQELALLAPLGHLAPYDGLQHPLRDLRPHERGDLALAHEADPAQLHPKRRHLPLDGLGNERRAPPIEALGAQDERLVVE